MREEGVISVLVNSNPATIMTDEEVADIVYIEPLTVEILTRIIERERPDGLLPTLGGQTGLNLAVDWRKPAFWTSIMCAARHAYRDHPQRFQTASSLKAVDQNRRAGAGRHTVNSLGEARKAAKEHRAAAHYPALLHPGRHRRRRCLHPARTGGNLSAGLTASPIHQVLLEQWVGGWKEIEYEVMRDAADNCITVCNMENFDPMGVHTGDSIVVAPSQTLTDNEYQMLRTASLNIIRALKIEGGCNVQFALDPYE